MAEHVTRYELEQLRDKMTVVTQQSVAASLSAWHDKMEQSVRNVERQVHFLFFYAQFVMGAINRRFRPIRPNISVLFS